ncbi:hypothetical protein [Corynebacterium uterequi]|uniref:DUF8175 domain-containing protein n=1 Tax=Corynebacterium uterequi TaxID=1072256 RepID=A0A0G3HF14_9CORY|nr:hypothetical protein [Corynebacterium uterequi]AKK10558.1 hypothetical protein CUTER_02720 [Corynebacterium uterequi]
MGTTQLQYVKARYLSVNSEAGPSSMKRAVPRGYAHSPQGAIMAAINQMTYAMYAQGDEVGEEIDKTLWANVPMAQEDREFLGLNERGAVDTARAQTLPGASGYRVVSCAKDLVVVELAFSYDPSGMAAPIDVFRLPMVWRKGDWWADLAGANSETAVRPGVDSLDGFTLVEYQ